ncbi:MAG: LamB/YcsF family protein [Epsilonproteobacteria bacterium]|nr:MAG: LamB/YcsF family protein [Campylobacterota bacterium]
MKLNCDIGEGFGIYKLNDDEKIYPHIDMANIACGFHASDANIMAKSVQLSKQNDVSIGAHVAYQDLAGFGRRTIVYDSSELSAIILYQIGALAGFCRTNGTKISYIKPHGAMYNDMMKDENIFKTILNTIQQYDTNLKLMLLSKPNNKKYEQIAKQYNIALIFELFLDRNYDDDGYLVSRTKENATIQDKNIVLQRVKTILKDEYLTSINNKKLYLRADSMCVHGDNKKAIELIQSVKNTIETLKSNS